LRPKYGTGLMGPVAATALLVGLVVVAGHAAPVAALKILSGGNMETILGALTDDFERASGLKLLVEYDRGSAVKARVRAGEAVDAVVVMRTDLNDLVQDGHIDPSSVADVARSSIGVIVRAGDEKPDMSSVEAVRRSLLAARSIAYSDPARGTASGVFFASLLDKLGIAEEVRAKSTLAVSERPIGGVIAALVAKGQAAIGIGQVSEMLPVPGIEFVAPLAAELQPNLVVAAGISTRSTARDGALMFIRYLSSPPAAKVIQANGMTPE
jgi:molybdate transport system substrate-binding protein